MRSVSDLVSVRMLQRDAIRVGVTMLKLPIELIVAMLATPSEDGEEGQEDRGQGQAGDDEEERSFIVMYDLQRFFGSPRAEIRRLTVQRHLPPLVR
jgi:hypothetical protein